MVQIKFTDIGEGMNEGEIIHYFVDVGDEVEVDQPLVELQTDKMVAEIPAPSAGKIKSIYYATGDIVTVGTVIMEIDTGKDAVITTKAEQQVLVDEGAASALDSQNSFRNPYNRILAAPYTRKIARELGIDIEQIKGSGPAGCVLEEDVYRFSNQSNACNDNQGESHTGIREDAEGTTIPFKGIRKQIATKVSHSLLTIPHVTHFDEVDVTNLNELRKTLKLSGDSISLAAFLVKATVICLKEHQLFNARLDEENEVIRLLTDYHMGIATNTEAGLLVPVIYDVDQKSIRTINKQMKELTIKAREGKLTAGDMKHGTFTVNNVGPLGGTGATPIINHPQTGIMTFYKTKRMPIVLDDDEIAIRSIMNISVSFDHRVIDGAQSIAFTNRFIELVENPNKLLLELI